ncbi:MAG: thiamine pyrophosphate-binding protein [Candidatus Thorarchaeota archaeon]
MKKLSGGELLIKCLLEEDVKFIFGVPGDQPYPIMDACYEHEDKIRWITFRHEAAAAHAADAYARITGSPGVCLGTVGPGAANLIPGVYAAYADSIPMIVLTAQNQSWKSYPDHGSMQALDQLTLFKAVTKWNVVVSHWKRIPELVQRAIRMAISGKPGPVHIDIPVDILYEEHVPDPEFTCILSKERYRTVDPPGGNPDAIRKAAAMLAEAKRPMIRAGGGVQRSGASDELLKLAEYLQTPVTTSASARGTIPEDHDLCMMGNAPGSASLVIQNEADVVLLVGCRLGDLDLFGQPFVWADSTSQKLIQIDIDGAMIAFNREVDIPIVGDAKVVLNQLYEALEAMTPQKERPIVLDEYHDVQKEWLADFNELGDSDQTPIHPLRLVKEIRDFFPRDAVCVVDGGNTIIWTTYIHPIYTPRSYLWAADSGHLGAGLGYAIGAKLSVGTRPVYLITGDGALGFNLGELETVRRLNLPIIIIVYNDRAFGMIKAGQKALYGGRYVGVDLYDIRWDLIARAMDCYGERVTDPAEIRPALQRAVDSGLPAVLDVLIDREINLEPPDFETVATIWLDGVEMPEGKKPRPKIPKTAETPSEATEKASIPAEET